MPENPSEKGMSSNDLITFADVKGSESKSKMENLDQSSLEEKVDLGNLELFPPDSYISEEIEEENFRIQDKSSENNIDNDTSDVKEEIIEVPGYEYEKEPIEFSSHSNEMCQICGLEFGNKTVLKIHISTVHPEDEKNVKNKIHQCDLCIFQSMHKTSLKKHIETIHYGKKGHQCSLCVASFSEKRQLDDHVQVVHEGKKFECTLCDTAKYNQRKNLNLHIRTVHEGMGIKHACTVCSYSFNSKASLRRHVESVHEGKRCKVCCKTYT